MITDFWTKSGTHYRRDDSANTVECLGPGAFPPHKVSVTSAARPPTVGRRFVAVWDGPGPVVGKAVMHTSTVVRVEPQASDAGALTPQVAAAAEALGIPRAEAVKIADTVRRPGGPLAVQVAEAVADGLAVLGAPASAMFENAGPEIWAALSRVTRGYSRAQLRWVRGARRAMADPGEDERWAVVASGRGCLRRARRAIARGHLDFAQIVSRRGDLVAIIDRRAHGIAVDPRY